MGSPSVPRADQPNGAFTFFDTLVRRSVAPREVTRLLAIPLTAHAPVLGAFSMAADSPFAWHEVADNATAAILSRLAKQLDYPNG